jgi:threonine dehydrogenase-like Zn-dependent dehydrogenase
MDTQATRVLVTDGTGSFNESTYQIKPLGANEIRVKAVMTGVCRSDIDMMLGEFSLLPIDMSGHEGLGEVIGLGSDVHDVEIGDYVATRGEPAYADEYNAQHYVQVPELHPRYIVEPVACGINIGNSIGLGSTLIVGTGFLATVIAQWLSQPEGFTFTLESFKERDEPDLVGNSNLELLKDYGYEPYESLAEINDTYDNVVILKPVNWRTAIDLVKENGRLIIGSPILQSTLDFSEALWKNVTIHCPSPRDKNFNTYMDQAVDMIECGKLDVDSFWTQGYNRETEWKQAFADGVNRPQNYTRGYIEWD